MWRSTSVRSQRRSSSRRWPLTRSARSSRQGSPTSTSTLTAILLLRMSGTKLPPSAPKDCPFLPPKTWRSTFARLRRRSSSRTWPLTRFASSSRRSSPKCTSAPIATLPWRRFGMRSPPSAPREVCSCQPPGMWRSTSVMSRRRSSLRSWQQAESVNSSRRSTPKSTSTLTATLPSRRSGTGSHASVPRTWMPSSFEADQQ
mmetsp:Transcript_37073/g.106773  ORF Transcript_37073/g.106773 Transcript_37073/m.106773 type:complete len:201 (+) Transcript_37073:365-967(+)